MQDFLKKYSDKRIAKDENAGFDFGYLSDESIFDGLPVLIIDLIAEGFVEDGYLKDYPCLTLYEDDSFTNRVLKYCE